MKKFSFFLMVILTISISESFSQNRSIRFLEKSWKEVLQTARIENKMIFVDAYASWCGPCKWMAANIFTNDTVADYYNKAFICAKIDMEKGEGPVLAKKFSVGAYPTLLFLDTTGSVVHKKVGAERKAPDYIELARIAQDPQECLAFYLREYKAGVRTPQFMLTYFDRVSDTYTPVDSAVNQYFSNVSESDLTSRTNWEIICKHVNDMHSKTFRYLVQHIDQFEKIYGNDSVNSKITEVYTNALAGFIRSRNFTQAGYSQLCQEILKSGFSGAQKIVSTADQWLQKSR